MATFMNMLRRIFNLDKTTKDCHPHVVREESVLDAPAKSRWFKKCTACKCRRVRSTMLRCFDCKKFLHKGCVPCSNRVMNAADDTKPTSQISADNEKNDADPTDDTVSDTVDTATTVDVKDMAPAIILDVESTIDQIEDLLQGSGIEADASNVTVSCDDSAADILADEPLPMCSTDEDDEFGMASSVTINCDHVEQPVVADGPSDECLARTRPVSVEPAPAPTMSISVCPDSVQSGISLGGDGGVGDVEKPPMTVVPGPLVAWDGAGDAQGEPREDDVESGMDDIFPGYTTDTVAFIDGYMCLPDDDVVVWGKSVRIGDVRTVYGHDSWLNDDAINCYMQLIVDRDPSRVYAFNAHFYPLLSSCGYQAVQSCTSERDIFVYDLVLLPVYENAHWTLVCVNFGDKTIEYFDSLGGTNDECLETVLDYLYTESCWGMFCRPFDRDQWQLWHADDCPEQLNYDDCGVFTCINAEYLARGVRPNFTQSYMPRFRQRMCYEILTDHLLLGIDE